MNPRGWSCIMCLALTWNGLHLASCTDSDDEDEPVVVRSHEDAAPTDIAASGVPVGETVSVQSATAASSGGGSEVAGSSPVLIRTPDGLELDGQIDRPDVASRNGWSVLLIGGGVGNDLDWTAPGTIVVEGQPVQLTISGETHHDGPRISGALVEQSFVVMRYSTLSRSDPLRDEWPVRATPRSMPELLAFAHAALEVFVEQSEVDPGRLILLGHSLGAARACTLAANDDRVGGLVLLAPAYFTRPDNDAQSDVLGRHGMVYGEDVLSKRAVPVLALFGELDRSRAVNASSALALAARLEGGGLDVRVMPNLGHQLGPESEGRVGPIAPEALEVIAQWMAQVVARRDGGDVDGAGMPSEP